MALLHAKTAAGRQEIDDRARRLPAALRSILLMVDGQRDDDALRALLPGLRAPPDALEQLLAQGLIEKVGGTAAPARSPALTEGRGQDPELYRRLYDLMSESVRRHLGLKGYFMQLKIERCTDAAALEQLLPDLVAAIGKARSTALANRWLEETRQQLEPAVLG
ncbi:MAG: hypothetical protein QHC77_03685 [Stenotrophomonas sp.]|jgi:hypothetical protein|uniref:hypothetical protein n=1 Tax=Stenotrophomonas TaxID=40323 RepID=UPI0005AED7E1|nr:MULTISPECIES: hypothetical protein [Stenotrophomonas]KIP80737.1 hypothetical protein SN15_15825 [Stenotrophomonas maltophilia]MDX3931021.1 hypothetical protein [Stenotrophomonas sp.]PKH75286.1 hypothetical protein CXF96_04870 [Stenotrophomonas sp. Betaine-02u-21]PKH76080.1 hypothetical protein CXF90_02990 [Stenotrophomonas sp. Betaine-02u-23]PKH97060.1 hypothetical protein CXG43_03455 [Stenotrophomonas sp. Bg11-02]